MASLRALLPVLQNRTEVDIEDCHCQGRFFTVDQVVLVVRFDSDGHVSSLRRNTSYQDMGWNHLPMWLTIRREGRSRMLKNPIFLEEQRLMLSTMASGMDLELYKFACRGHQDFDDGNNAHYVKEIQQHGFYVQTDSPLLCLAPQKICKEHYEVNTLLSIEELTDLLSK